MLAIESGAVSSYVGSPLEAFYDAWQPASAAEALGLDARAGGPLGSAPPLGAMAPWWPFADLTTFAATFATVVEMENAAKGRPLSADAGCLQHGPVSLDKGELEFARCVEIFETVRAVGFQRSSETRDGDVRGQVLVRDDGEYAVLVLNGQHRIAAAAATGLATVPIRFFHGSTTGSRVVYRSDVEYWPAVRGGWFSAPEALQVFDRVFDGLPPSAPTISIDHGYKAQRPVG